MMNYEKMTELFQNEDFQKEAEHFGTMEDFRKGFARYGLDLTEDEVADIIRRIAEKKLAEDQGELAEEELEDVAGGFVVSTGLFCVGVGVACVGVAALSAYVAYQALNWSYKRTK